MFWGTYNASYVEGLRKPGKSYRDSNLNRDIPLAFPEIKHLSNIIHHHLRDVFFFEKYSLKRLIDRNTFLFVRNKSFNLLQFERVVQDIAFS